MIVFGIALSVLRNHLRSAARSSNLLSPLHTVRVEETADAHTVVREALSMLKPDEREVLLLT